MFKLIIFIVIFIYLPNCSDKTIYSGKIINQEQLVDINFKNKDNLIDRLGNPSYIDPITNKYFYYSEKVSKKSIFDKKSFYSLLFVFEFDENDNIINSKVFDLNNTESVKIIDEETESNIVKRGLLEKIFGGIGAQQEIPSSQ